jgi:hypothetical protein
VTSQAVSSALADSPPPMSPSEKITLIGNRPPISAPNAERLKAASGAALVGDGGELWRDMTTPKTPWRQRTGIRV